MGVHLIQVEQSNPDYTMGVVLDTNHFIMHIYWNDRQLAWFFDMLQPDQTPIINGVKVVLGQYLGRTAQVPPFTTGVIGAVDTSGSGLDAGFDDLGSRVVLVYVPVLDLLANITVLKQYLGV